MTRPAPSRLEPNAARPRDAATAAGRDATGGAGAPFLFITHAAAPSGAELKLMRLAQGLAPDAAVLVLQDGPLVGALRERGVPVEVLPLPGAVREVRREHGVAGAARLLPAMAGLIRRLAAHRARHAVTVAFSQKAFVASALSQPLVRRPLVWALNDIVSEAHFSPSLLKLAVGLANRTVRQVVANSRATADSFVAAGGRAALSRVIYPGIDLSACSRPPPREASSRLRVGSFGRLASWKGQHILLRALAQVPETEAWIVGAPQFGETAYAAELERLALELGVADRVRFLGHRDDVPELMAACDVIAHTSTAPEPFGQVIVEGLASGKPVIATAAGGALEIVEHETDGLLVPPNDADALAATLHSLARDPELCQRLAAAGRNAAAAFSTAAMVESWSACLRSLSPLQARAAKRFAGR